MRARVGSFVVVGVLSCVSLVSQASASTAVGWSTTFDLPVCGRISQPPRGCEFGVQGDVWTQDGIAYLQRESLDGHHVHLGKQEWMPGAALCTSVDLSLPATVPFVGKYVQLIQVTPQADADHPARVVELRLYPDRSLGIATFGGRDVVLLQNTAPVDDWFTVSLCAQLGASAGLRLSAFGETATLVTSTLKNVSQGARQTLGGTLGTESPWIEKADNWTLWNATT